MPTLADIANEVGVSSKTVSLTLRGKRCASQETINHIMEVAERTGYLKHRRAKVSLKPMSPSIGFISDSVITTPHSIDILRGAQTEARANSKTLLIGSLAGELGTAEDCHQIFRSNKVSSVIYASFFRRAVPSIKQVEYRNVIYTNCFDENDGSNAVLPDDELGGYQQAEYLLRLGHKRIGVLTLPMQAAASSLRMKGIARALFKYDTELEMDLCRTGIDGYLPAGETYVAYERALELLHRDDRPTAIICGNDRIALMVYSAASTLGLRIPEDLSVVGFDDFEPISTVIRPKLTSVRLPYFEMGRRAVRMILSRNLGQIDFAPVPCPLIIRDSCAAPPF